MKYLKEYIDDFMEFAFDENSGKSNNTRMSYLGKLLEFNEILEEIKGKDFNPSTICFDDIQNYIKALSKKGNKSSSVENKFITVKVFIKFLSKRKVVSKSILLDDDSERPMLPKIKKEKVKFLESKEYIQMIENCKWNPDSKNNLYDNEFNSIRNVTLLILILSTGLRRNEALCLKRSEIYNNTINTYGKGGKSRIIPLNETAKYALDVWFQYLDKKIEKKIKNNELGDFNTNLAFPSNRGGKISDGVYFEIVQRALSSIGRARYLVDENYNFILDKNGNKILNEKGVRNHSLRKAFASQLLHQGVNLEVIRVLLDHENLSTTQKYLGISEDDKKEAVNSIFMGDIGLNLFNKQ